MFLCMRILRVYVYICVCVCVWCVCMCVCVYVLYSTTRTGCWPQDISGYMNILRDIWRNYSDITCDDSCDFSGDITSDITRVVTSESLRRTCSGNRIYQHSSLIRHNLSSCGEFPSCRAPHQTSAPHPRTRTSTWRLTKHQDI